MLNFDDILLELSYKVPEGIVDLTKTHHLVELKRILKENGVDDPSPYIVVAEYYFGQLKSIEEVKSKKSSKADSVLNATIINPTNGNKIKVASALTYGQDDPAYKVAIEYLKKNDVSREDFEKATKPKTKKGKEPETQPKVLAGGELESKAEIEKRKKEKQQKVEKAFSKAYGKEGKGPLLQKSETTEDALRNGYVEGAPWVAPGNAGSNFNENFSNEGVMILTEEPDLDEESLARIIYKKVKGSKLAGQQKPVSIGSEQGLSVPDDIPEKDKELFKNCLITARSARVKKDRAEYSSQRAQEQVGFGKQTKNLVFGGTTSDLSRCEQELQNANKIYVYDAETDQTVEIPKEIMIKWLDSGGGGENASDTVVLTKDENGNIIYQGWSDKKTLKDLQGNSSLNNDYKQAKTTLQKFDASGKIKINPKKFREAMDILETDQAKIAEIESGLKNIIGIQAQYFLKASSIKDMEESAFTSSNTKKHMNKFASVVDSVLKGNAKSNKKTTAIRHELLPPKKKESEKEYLERFNKWASGQKFKDGEYLKLLANLAVNQPDSLTADDRKIIERVAVEEKQKFLDSGKKVPTALDTDEALSALRKKSLDLQKKTFQKLNTIMVVNRNGKRKRLGDVLGYEDAKNALHLDKINKPKNQEDYHQFLKRNTQLVLEGIAVTPKILQECIGASNGKDLENNFELLFEERYQRDEKTNRITGKVVYVYAYDKGGKKKRIAEKVYRPKQGQYAPTANTVQWSKEMQTCFDSKK